MSPIRPLPTKWHGNDDTDEWWLEIEPDRFSTEAPMVISIWMEGESEGETWDGLATATPEQAREMAATLLFFADSVEKQNALGASDDRAAAMSLTTSPKHGEQQR